MPGKALISRVPKHFVKTLTLTGASGLGLVSVDIPVLTITGRVLMRELAIFCSTALASAGGGVLSMGTANNPGGIIPKTTATIIDINEFWRDTTPELESSPVIKDEAIAANVIIQPTVATVESGVLEVSIYWSPLSIDGNLA